MTNLIRVSVEPDFLINESNPASSYYLFAYTVKIENLGIDTVQVISREWQIFSEGKLTQEVVGEGVIGLKPVIPPGGDFSYTSGAIIGSPTGSMLGVYHLLSHSSGELFEVAIPEFKLLAVDFLH